MKTSSLALVAMLLALSACSGGNPATVSQNQSGGAIDVGNAAAITPDAKRKKYGRIVLHITVPRLRHRHPGRGMHPHYIPGSAASITITLNTVNGSTPPNGLATSTNSSLTSCSGGCTVVGPYSPPGSDNFTVTIFGGPVGNPGPALATAAKTFTIVAGTANNFSITLAGVPAQFALQGTAPSATANTVLSATALPIEVEDADGDVITGTYSTPVTITDPDTTSLTACGGLCGSALEVGGSAASKTAVLASSTDASNVTISYGGMDIAPAALTASTSAGALTAVGSVTFAPTVASISYSGPLNGSSQPEIDLYAPLSGGTGSTGSFTDSQSGWTNAPYNQSIGESDTCDSAGNTIATYAQTTGTNGTAWTATAIASPVAGTCTATLTGGGGATLAVKTTYTSGSIGVNVAHRRP
jgi:hypothetical protein